MKNQGLFSSKDRSKKLKCRLLHFLFGALRVKIKQKRSIIVMLGEYTYANTNYIEHARSLVTVFGYL